MNEERVKSILLEEAYRTIKVNERAGQVTVPMVQAAIRSLAVATVKDNRRARRLFTQLITTVEREKKRLHDEWLDTAITYKVEWEQELQRRERLGIQGPSAPSRPRRDRHANRQCADHGAIYLGREGRIRHVLASKIEFHREFDEVEQLLRDEPDNPYGEQVLADIEHDNKLLAIIRKVIPD